MQQAAAPQTWDIQADVVVVGFGAAGACAALEAAAAGRDVVVLDRFAGGGATALSGGVIYAGGGTSHQLTAGVRDSPQAMFSYLSLEVGDAVSPVECRTLRGGPRWARAAHGVLHHWSAKPYLYAPKVGRVLHRPVAWLERRYGRPLLVGARGGVVLAAGGFVANRQMMREHAPAYRGALPLGTPGDDGSGIRLGVQVGGATAFLDHVSVWRFLSPPPALLAGVLVDRAGLRVCDESRYGAAIGEAMMARHGQAWLFADRATITEARRRLRRSTL